jgi:hypothetical protein
MCVYEPRIGNISKTEGTFKQPHRATDIVFSQNVLKHTKIAQGAKWSRRSG